MNIEVNKQTARTLGFAAPDNPNLTQQNATSNYPSPTSPDPSSTMMTLLTLRGLKQHQTSQRTLHWRNSDPSIASSYGNSKRKS